MFFTAAQLDKGEMMEAHRRWLWMAIGGLLIGFVAGLLGVGGGFLMVPMMIAMGYETKKAAATSAFVVIFSSFSGFAGHVAEAKHLDWPLMLVTSVGVVVGAQIGARVMRDKMKPRWIKRIFGVILMGVAAKLLWNELT